MITEKPCTVCKTTKSLSAFKKNKRMKLGRTSECRACSSIRDKKYREEHKKEAKAYRKEWKEKQGPVAIKARRKAEYEKHRPRYLANAKQWREANPERAAASVKANHDANREERRTYCRKWNEDNQEHLRQYRKQMAEHLRNMFRLWRKANPEKTAAQKAKRRANLKNAQPDWVDESELLKFYKLRLEMNAITGIEHQVDHIVPLAGKNVCGLHVPWNLRVIPARENQSKKNKLLEHLLEV